MKWGFMLLALLAVSLTHEETQLLQELNADMAETVTRQVNENTNKKYQACIDFSSQRIDEEKKWLEDYKTNFVRGVVVGVFGGVLSAMFFSWYFKRKILKGAVDG